MRRALFCGVGVSPLRAVFPLVPGLRVSWAADRKTPHVKQTLSRHCRRHPLPLLFRSLSTVRRAVGPSGDQYKEEEEEEEEEETLGPLAVIVVGFSTQELTLFRKMMAAMEAEMVRVIPMTSAMLDRPLCEVLDMQGGPDVEAGTLAGQEERIIVLSGMFQSEVMAMVQAFGESGLPDAAFCCVVANNYRRQCRELFAAVAADHREASKETRSETT